jgi:hypothetical protein
MRISWRRVALCVPGLILACSSGSGSNSSNSSSNNSSSRNTSSDNGGGGCGGGGGSSSTGSRSNVKDAPPDGSNPFGNAPSSPAPTGQQWKPVETDEGCGRTGIQWILVDEVCGDGEGNDDPGSLHAPMFRDGAIVSNHLFAVDATHLWTIDLATPNDLSRASLLTGLGTPLAVDKRASANELVLAAGSAGLVMVDATNPAAPTRSRSIELAGKAFDVNVSGDKAYVAMGHQGVAEVDLATAVPSIKHSWPVSGFSAGLAARGKYAYVAACTTMKVVNLETGQVVAQTWVGNPIQNDRLIAPAKKVTLVGDVAFVAAGRYGAVAIDITNPEAPSVLGNCTIDNQPSFYASGVRANASADHLYVAGGEWGILPVAIDLANPKLACNKMVAQAPPPKEPNLACSAKPPWEIVPWEKIWAPPPPGKDPVQTLPVGNDRIYAFGDARRIGVRAVDVRDTTDPSLPIVTRFDEPRMLLGLVASPTRVVAIGPRGGVFQIGANATLTRSSATSIAENATLQASSAVTLLADGRWAALAPTGIAIEGKTKPIQVSGATSLAAAGATEIAVTSKYGVHIIDANTDSLLIQHAVLHSAALPLSIAADANAIYYAAPEWTNAARIEAGKSSDLDAHDVFDSEDIMDASLWRKRLPRRHLITTTQGLVEIAGVGPAVGLVVHGPGAFGVVGKKVSLPVMTYAAAASDGNHVYLTGIDRSLYKSYLVSVDISGTTPKVVSVEAFTGAASGVAAAGGRVFVADADGALRAYAISPTNGSATFIGSTAVAQ